MNSRNVQGNFFVTPEEVRFVWPAVFSPSTTGPDNKVYDKPRYEVTLAFPKMGPDKDHDPAFRWYSRKIMEVFRARHGHEYWEQVKTDSNSWPIRNGDEPHFVQKNPWAAGHWLIKCWSQNPTRISDARNNEITREDAMRMAEPPLKSGDYGKAAINFWTYEWQGKHGVSGGLEAIKIMRQGDPIGGAGRSVQAIFGPSEGEPVYGLQPPNTGAPAPSYGPPETGWAPTPQPGYGPGDRGGYSGPPQAEPGGYGPPAANTPPPAYGAPQSTGYPGPTTANPPPPAASGYGPPTGYGGPGGYPGQTAAVPPPPASGYGPPNGYGGPPAPTPPTMPPVPPGGYPVAPPPPLDPTLTWQRDPSGQWMLNPETHIWMPVPPAPVAPPPTQSGYVAVQPPSPGPTMPQGYGPKR